MATESYYIGFDVGTGSGRAALLDKHGKIVAQASEPTVTFRSDRDHRIFEQSTSNIWSALSTCCQRVLAQSGVKPEDVKGISFDATCSLAVVDKNGVPIGVSEDEGLGKTGAERNVILWADHRAEDEAMEINQTGEGVLGFVGGTMSLEMEIPKTLWLKRHMKPEDFERSYFFDLPDWRAKMVHPCDNNREEISEGWSESFLRKIGLDSLVDRQYEQIGGAPGKNGIILTAGQPVGHGLTDASAKELGLLPGTPVGSAVIDAYAGWIGTVAAKVSPNEPAPTISDSSRRLAACAGTSTCHIAQSANGILVPGVWGPYRDAVFPGYWMNEGGQSSTGQLIDFVLKTHPAWPKLQKLAKEQGKGEFEMMETRLEQLKQERGSPSRSNRSPLADPKMRGMIMGLTLDDNISDLALKFHVTLEAIALQTRHILEEMNGKGHKIDSIYMSGSQAKNRPLMDLLATVCNVKVIIPPEPSAAVVIGAAMLGRAASELHERMHGKDITSQQAASAEAQATRDELWDIMVDMTQPGEVILSTADDKEKQLLDVKYKIFRESIEIQKRWRDMVAAVI